MRILLIAFAFLSSLSQAATVQLSSGWTATVNDFACQTVVNAFLGTYNAVSGDCAYQVVSTGTMLVFRNASGGSVAAPTVSAVTGWTAPAAAGAVNYQPQIDALTSRIVALESAVTAINNKLNTSPAAGHTLTDAEYSQFSAVMTSASAPYDYAQGGALFAAVFAPTLGLYFLVRGLMEFYSLSLKARRVV